MMKLEETKLYKDWTKSQEIVAKKECKHGTVWMIVESRKNYRLLRFFRIPNKWVVSCDVDTRDLLELSKYLLKQIEE